MQTWKWVIAYVSCVVLWFVCDFALEQSHSYLFENFMRLPLETLVYLAGWQSWSISDLTHWSRTWIVIAYAGIGFLPLILVPLVKRYWPLWLTAAFVLAHPVVWYGIGWAIASHH